MSSQVTFSMMFLSIGIRSLISDYGLRSLSNLLDPERYHYQDLSYPSRSRKHSESYQATGINIATYRLILDSEILFPTGRKENKPLEPSTDCETVSFGVFEGDGNQTGQHSQTGPRR